MGTEISLNLEGLELTYSKNHMGIDHGCLFQACDRKPLRSSEIDYDYFERVGEDPTLMEMAFVRPLGAVAPRLELMGFTLDRARREYEAIVREELETERDDDEPAPHFLDFEAFCTFANSYSLADLDSSFIADHGEEAEAKIRGRFTDADLLARLPGGDPYGGSAYSEAGFFGGQINILHPYSVLRVLAENSRNRASDLIWQYGPLVRNGWASVDDFKPEARRTDTFLIATEGSSDTHILRHALSLLRPEVLDFFRFIDVENGHPFSGAGNLRKFAEGLAKIDVHNQVVFIFDNDAEGVDAANKLEDLTLPPNMRRMVLPSLDRFKAFPARGPDGVRDADLNGRAVAIECFLDLKLTRHSGPQVTWTHFVKALDAYHGALDHKDDYTRAFLKQTKEELATTGYDVSGLEALLTALTAECCGLASASRVLAPWYDR